MTPFWMYVCASLVLIVSVPTMRRDWPQHHGVERILPFGRLFFAMSMAVFGSEHFTLTAAIESLIPKWIPGHLFWVYAVGAGFIAAGLGIAARVQARLAAGLVGATFLIFVLVMDLPAAVAHPENRFFWALALRELAFSGGALAFALAPLRATVPRFFVGVPLLFYGVENLLHPANVPGVPLQLVTPGWIPGTMVLNYVVGVMLLIGGVGLVANRQARRAAMAAGLSIVLAILWVYLPMVVRTPTGIVALNYFFDTLLFCGSILLVANASGDAGS